MESPKPKPTQYRSYLLKVWRDESGMVLRASLQSTVSERVYHFVDAEELLSFLITAPSSDNTIDDESR